MRFCCSIGLGGAGLLQLLAGGRVGAGAQGLGQRLAGDGVEGGTFNCAHASWLRQRLRGGGLTGRRAVALASLRSVGFLRIAALYVRSGLPLIRILRIAALYVRSGLPLIRILRIAALYVRSGLTILQADQIIGSWNLVVALQLLLGSLAKSACLLVVSQEGVLRALFLHVSRA